MNEYESASFVCEISHDEVQTQWYKDDSKMKADDNIRMRQDGRNSNGELILEWGAGWENKQNGLTSELKLRRFSREFYFYFWVAVRLGQ